MHAICIDDKSFVQLQRHTFNRNRVTSETKSSYTVYKVKQSDYRKRRKTSPNFIDEMADKSCNSSTSVLNRQKLSSAHRKWISLVHSPSIRTSFFWGSSSCCIFYSGASFHPVKGKLSLRKQQSLPHLEKILQEVAWYCRGPQLGSKFQISLPSSSNLTISKSVSSWSRPVYH